MSDANELGSLVAQVRAGHPSALDALLAKLRPCIRQLIRRCLGGEIGAGMLDTSDLVQETLLRVGRGFDRFHGEEVPHLLAWVGRIAKNVVIDKCFRPPGAGQGDAGREVGDEPLAHAQGGTDPAERALRDEEAVRLSAALECLPALYREVLEARFFDGLPFREIGRRMGKSEGAVRVLCLRAIQKLRKVMGDRS